MKSARSTFLRAAGVRAASLALLWWILVEGRADGWAVGIVAVLVATGASLSLLPPGQHRIRPGAVLRFLGFFVHHSVRGGVQVAGMALAGRRALQPGVLHFQLALPPGGLQVLMVNVLSVMPGTVAVELANDSLRLHVLDERLPVEALVRTLERRIAALVSEGAQ